MATSRNMLAIGLGSAVGLWGISGLISISKEENPLVGIFMALIYGPPSLLAAYSGAHVAHAGYHGREPRPLESVVVGLGALGLFAGGCHIASELIERRKLERQKESHSPKGQKP